MFLVMFLTDRKAPPSLEVCWGNKGKGCNIVSGLSWCCLRWASPVRDFKRPGRRRLPHQLRLFCLSATIFLRHASRPLDAIVIKHVHKQRRSAFMKRFSINAHCCVRELQQKCCYKSTFICNIQASELGNSFPVDCWRT